MPEPARILLIRPSALGDVCRSVPVLASLRRAYPSARLDWLVQDSFADAVRWHPALGGVVEFPRRALGEAVRSGRLGEVLAFRRRLRGAGYGLVIDCQGLARSGVFARWTRAGRRVGYANARELGWLGYTEKHRVDPAMHAVDRMLELVTLAGVPPVGDMRLYAGEEAREWSRGAAGSGTDFAVIAPTSRWAGKRWPAERFAELTRALLAMGVERVALVGAASEREQCGPLLELAASEPRVVDLIGKTTVGQLMAVVEASRLVVANDSAVLHMAVGFDRPLVALYGPTRVDLVGPYKRERDVIQHITPADRLDHKDHASGRALMERIGVEEVVRACGERLAPS